MRKVEWNDQIRREREEYEIEREREGKKMSVFFRMARPVDVYVNGKPNNLM